MIDFQFEIRSVFLRSYEVTIDEVATGAVAAVDAGAEVPKLNDGAAETAVVAGAVVAAVRVGAALDASAVELGAPNKKPSKNQNP